MLVGSRAMDSLFTFEMPPGKELAAARFSNGDCYGGRFGTCSDEVLYDHGASRLPGAGSVRLALRDNSRASALAALMSETPLTPLAGFP